MTIRRPAPGSGKGGAHVRGGRKPRHTGNRCEFCNGYPVFQWHGKWSCREHKARLMLSSKKRKDRQ